MYSEDCLRRLTDRNSPRFFEDESQPYVLLFESRYDTNVGKMIDALGSALKRFQFDIASAICVIEEAPALSKQFDVTGVPTLVAGLGDTVLGKSLGTRSTDDLASLIGEWFSVGRKPNGDAADGRPELAKELTASHPETKAVLMSGYADNAVVRNGVLELADGFLQRPFGTDAA